jgi:hypothetical protein
MDEVGIPERLIMDGATEFTGRHTDFVKEARRMRIMSHTTTEKGCNKNQNHISNKGRGWRMIISRDAGDGIIITHVAEHEIGVLIAKDGSCE